MNLNLKPRSSEKRLHHGSDLLDPDFAWTLASISLN